MASKAGAIRAGRAYVELFADNSALSRNLKEAENRLKAFGASIVSIGQRIAAIGLAGTTPFAFAVKAASDLLETTTKLEYTFKGNAAAVTQWANVFAKQVGRSEKETKDFVANAGAVFKGLGFGSLKAAALAETVTALAFDLGSFFNKADVETFEAIISGLLGQSRPLKDLGVVVQEAQEKMELMSQGIDPESASAMEQVLARMNVILKSTQDAQGDVIRTMGNFANSFKALKGEAQDFVTEVGNALLPAATAIVQALKSAIAPMVEFVRENRGLVIILASVAAGTVALGGALVALGVAAKIAGVALAGAGVALKGINLAMIVFASPIGRAITLVGLLGTVIATQTEIGQKAITWLGEKFDWLLKTVTSAWKGINDALTAGDFALAGRIALAALRVEWERGILFLKTSWEQFVVAFKTAFIRASHLIARAFIDVGAKLQEIWANLFELGDLNKKLQEIEMFRQEAQKAITDQEQAAVGAVKPDERGLNEAQAALDDAMKEFEAMKKDAAEKAAGVKGKKPSNIVNKLDPDRLDNALDRAKKTIDVKGTFNALAARGLGVGDTLSDEQKKTTDAVAGLRTDFRQAVRNNRLVFGT